MGALITAILQLFVGSRFGWDTLLDVLRKIMVGTAFLIFASGCAADRATDGAMKLATVVAEKVSQELPVNAGHLQANGKINNPHYRILAAMVTGVYCDIGLDGAELSGELYGVGSGGPTSPDPAMAEFNREILGRPDLQAKVFGAWKEWRASTQPANK